VAVAPIAPPSLVPAATVPTAAADAGEATLPHAIDPLAEVRDDIDATVLPIFLEEAAEVLDSIAEQRRRLEGNHGDRESLRTARRGFHTLKGSGRMVGLTDLGELAYHVEKIHNRLLEEDRPVTSTVVAMVDVAERNFRQWVEALSATGRVTIDPGELHAAILAVEAQLPGNRDSVLKPVPAVPSGESGAVAAVAVEGMPSVPPSAEGPAEPIAPLRLVPAAELAALSTEALSPAGRIGHLAAQPLMSETPPFWARPPVPLGFSPPEWPAG